MIGRLRASAARAASAGGPGVVLLVDAPALGARAHVAAGDVAPGSRLRVASVSKTVTAATALRLVEDGALGLDEPLDGSWDVTLREALGHRGGLPDAFPRLLAAQLAPGGPPPRAGPWDPRETIALVAGEPRLPRGRFRYSDTGYVLAGMAIERAAGEPLHRAYRRLVLDPLGMDATFLEGREPPRGAPVVPWSARFDPGALDPTIDWAGGGLVSTAGDLLRLVRGLHERRVVGEAALRQMTELAPVGRGGLARLEGYGLGLGGWRAEGARLVGHGGIWGAFAYLWPETGAALVGSVNRMGPFGEAATALLDDAVAALRAG